MCFYKKDLKLFNSKIFNTEDMVLFAKGANRYCYIYPDKNNLCVKIVREDSISKLRSKRSFMKKLRPNWWFDDNKNEYKAYQQAAISENPDIYQHIPKCYGWVKTEKGDGLVLDYFTQDTGEACPTLESYLHTHGYTNLINEKLNILAEYLRSTQLLTKNILPHNVIISKDGILKIIDGLGASSPLNPANFSKTARGYYIERRIERMFLRAKWECGNKNYSWAETEQQAKHNQ